MQKKTPTTMTSLRRRLGRWVAGRPWAVLPFPRDDKAEAWRSNSRANKSLSCSRCLAICNRVFREHRGHNGMQGAHQSPSQHQRKFAALLAASCAALAGLSIQAAELKPEEIRIVFAEGSVEFSQAGATDWQPASTNNLLREAYRLRTGERSRAMLLWADRAAATIGESTVIEILAADAPKAPSGVHLWRGLLSFFHRDEPGRFRIMTRSSMAGIEGTEFVVAVDPANDATTLSVIDGKVSFSNPQGTLTLTNLEQAVAELGQASRRTPGFIVNHVLQWSFYYPGVLDADELPLTATERQTLADSLAAYRDGDLLDALEKYPANRQPESAAERVYHAALLLAVGLAEKSEAALALMEPATADVRTMRPAGALRLLIAVVKNPVGTHSTASLNSRDKPDAMERVPTGIATATEALALSYYEQSRAIREKSLQKALAAARRATELSPNFGFAWARVAELEFSFGRTREARQAVERSLALSPRNAQALALHGFLLAAQNKTRAALDYFDQAIAIDPALGNAWLGRGLCKIRLTPSFFSLSTGERAGVRANHPSQLSGMEDLLIAAAVEPQRSLLRSYLAKAWSLDHRNSALAHKELGLAMRLDPADPTPWLYRALLNQQENRINEGIRDLEKSQDLNDNRRVYRSQLQLDQDRAVRSANLALVYQDAGMHEVAVREAARAVAFDYANYSAHLFLANSYNAMRDPNLVNLRYETPAQSEYLLANLLSPATAGIASPIISQQEYSRLFTQDRFGLVSWTEYASSGNWLQSASQYGVLNRFSYALEGSYEKGGLLRPNSDYERYRLAALLKQQFTDNDSAFLDVSKFRQRGGDLATYYDEREASRTFRLREEQEPFLTVGYHREWKPGVHTLAVASRLNDELQFTNSTQPTYLVFQPDGPLTSANGLRMREAFRGNLEIYSTELQQILETPWGATIIGGRLQYGNVENRNFQNFPSAFASAFPDPPEPAAAQHLNSVFRRYSLYGYQDFQIAEPLLLTAGLTWDRMTFPENFRTAPLSLRGETVDHLSPKAGLVWTPFDTATLRFAYTRSLAGASLDQSHQLEPSQVAGINQSFRSLIPESVAGANAGAKFETYGLFWDQKLRGETYVGMGGELLSSKVNRTVGAFASVNEEISEFAITSGLREHLRFYEQAAFFTVDQLVGRDWAFGGRYRVSSVDYSDEFPRVPNGLIFENFSTRTHVESLLHRLTLQANYNHPSGFFGRVAGDWYHQSNQGYAPKRPGDEFWQVHAFAGYRTPNRRIEVAVGVLNLTDRHYRLNPLTLYSELPRERTMIVRLRLNL